MDSTNVDTCDVAENAFLTSYFDMVEEIPSEYKETKYSMLFVNFSICFFQTILQNLSQFTKSSHCNHIL